MESESDRKLVERLRAGLRSGILSGTPVELERLFALAHAGLAAKGLVEAVNNVPTWEYGEAQREGCDPNGAWDCFIDALEEWSSKALAAYRESVKEEK